jgi:uncharacterized protein DUF551
MSGPDCDICGEYFLDCTCKKDKWVKCSDRLPEKDTPVLCFHDGYIDVMEYWYDEDGKPSFYYPPAPPCNSVTHWMPIPNAPKD